MWLNVDDLRRIDVMPSEAASDDNKPRLRRRGVMV